MPYINYTEKEIAFKLVYFGPGMSGKTTNLIQIYQRLANDIKGEMLSLDTANERTLFFDFFPLQLGRIEGFSVKFNMYTVPGQIYYEASRKLILDGADGIVFVADSQKDRKDENIVSFKMMRDNLDSYGISWENFPLVLQYNKRDCENPLSLGTLESELNLNSIPVTEAVAIEGKGVMETVHILARNIILQFQI